MTATKPYGRAALYIGGFLGPFGGGVVSAMLAEMGADLGVSTGTAASSLTAYLFPFAALLLVSGTLGARWGARRTVRIAYVVYIVASLTCALAPVFAVLQAGRVLQGCANAFTTPLLMAALAASTPAHRLGRALGTFGALQAAGQTSAPLVGGIAAEASWRWAFVVIALVAAALAIVGVPMAPGRAPTGSRRPKLREALRWRVIRIGFVAMLAWGALGGMSFLVAFRVEDDFGLGPTGRGLVLTCFGLTGIIAARPVGSAIDRVGARRAVVIGALTGAVLIATTGTAGLLVVTVAAWAAAGVPGQLMLVGVNSAVLGGDEPNRGGAVSVVQSFRFAGSALTPLVLTPVYDAHAVASFLVPAVLLAVFAPLLMPGRGRDRLSAG
ncbi:MFS transporter [Aldersonia kunmingensis]|uniref:MFS transporter n=1 Tax=Aldersonia kunmingensis TaxID=408066 RepID=UPI00082F7982|nr:MFS transporter [Aldersonia kunmingensis]